MKWKFHEMENTSWVFILCLLLNCHSTLLMLPHVDFMKLLDGTFPIDREIRLCSSGKVALVIGFQRVLADLLQILVFLLNICFNEHNTQSCNTFYLHICMYFTFIRLNKRPNKVIIKVRR